MKYNVITYECKIRCGYNLKETLKSLELKTNSMNQLHTLSAKLISNCEVFRGRQKFYI